MLNEAKTTRKHPISPAGARTKIPPASQVHGMLPVNKVFYCDFWASFFSNGGTPVKSLCGGMSEKISQVTRLGTEKYKLE